MRKPNAHSEKIYFEDTVFEDDVSISNASARYFESVYTEDSHDTCDSKDCDIDLNISGLDVNINEIYEAINNLNSHSAPGHDGIHPLLVKSNIFIMFRILWTIFNKLLTKDIFPSIWKTCLIHPIHKSGSRSDIKNWRPISIQSVFLKIFDGIVIKKLSFLCKNIIIHEQHGFVAGCSTCTNLMLYHHFLTNAVESGYQVDAIYTDFRKAFDSVSHSILIKTLGHGFFG